MNRGAVVAILAAVGAGYSGPITPDAVAFASALVSGSPDDLENFISEHPGSKLVPQALIRLAGDCDNSAQQFFGCYGN